MRLRRNIIRLTRQLAVAVLMTTATAPLAAQIAVSYPGGKHSVYRSGDTLSIDIRIRPDAQSCIEGMRKTYVYLSACETIHQSPWKQMPGHIFRKQMLIRLSAGAKGKARITIVRDTDRESLSRQETINISNNGK